MGFLSAFQRLENEKFVVAPGGLFGEAYVLDTNQFQEFEPWLIENRLTRRASQKRLVIAAITIIGIIAAFGLVFLDLVSVEVAIFIVLPTLILAVCIAFKEDRNMDKEMMKTFPFLDAPISQYKFLTRLKRLLYLACSDKGLKNIAWIILGFDLLTIILQSIGADIFPRALLEDINGDGLASIATVAMRAVCAAILMIIYPLSLLVTRFRFKKRTGHQLNTKSLYIDELGHELNFSSN